MTKSVFCSFLHSLQSIIDEALSSIGFDEEKLLSFIQSFDAILLEELQIPEDKRAQYHDEFASFLMNNVCTHNDEQVESWLTFYDLWNRSK